MSNNLTNAYALHAELSEIQKILTDEKATLRANKYAQQFFTVTTWIIYLLFAAAMYAAPLWVLQSFFTANSGNWVAITVLSVFLVGFPTALALGKHGGYKALSKRGVDPRWMGAIIAFFIASGIYFEITSATSQQQEKAHQQAATTLGAAITAPPTVAIDTSLADKIAKASKKLAQCQANLGKPGYKHCDGDKADVASLQASQAAASAASVQAVGVAVNAQQERMERERDSNALPIAKSFSELFGSTLATGAVIAALIASLIFEVSHSLTIYNEWRIKREIDVLQGQLKQLKINYFHQTGKQFDSTDFREGEIIDLVSMRENGKIEHFNDRLQDGVSPAPAAAKKEFSFGIIPTRNSGSLAAENRRKYPQEIVMPMTDRPTPHDYGAVPRKERDSNQRYRDDLRDGSKVYADQPLDRPTPAIPETIPPTTKRDSETTTKRDSGIVEQRDSGDMLYQRWKGAVSAGELSTACGRFYKFARDNGSFTGIANRVLDTMWNDFGERGVKEGWLLHNPDFVQGSTKPKYVLNSSYKHAA